MRGAKLEISDPGLPGPHNEESEYVITESSFERKIVTLLNERRDETEVRLHEGTLDIKETWKSVGRRQSVEILSMGFKLLLLPLFTALGSGLTLLWLGQSPWGGGASDSPEAPAQHVDQPADGGQGPDPSEEDEAVDQNASDPGREFVDATEGGDDREVSDGPALRGEGGQQPPSNHAPEGHADAGARDH